MKGANNITNTHIMKGKRLKRLIIIMSNVHAFRNDGKNKKSFYLSAVLSRNSTLEKIRTLLEKKEKMKAGAKNLAEACFAISYVQ